MTLDQQPLQLLIGGGVGLVSALIAGLVQHRIVRSGVEARSRRLPGCLMIVAGWLGMIGILVAAVSLAFTGRLNLAIVAGIGVLGGFFAGSASILFLLMQNPLGRSTRRRG